MVCTLYLKDSSLKGINVMFLNSAQRALERDAAVLGGGKLVAPAQTIPDFLEDKLSGLTCFLSNVWLLLQGALERVASLLLFHYLNCG